MSKVNTEFFIARRLSLRGQGDRGNVMVRIAGVTVGISIAVMIIALAVINGFRDTLTGKVVGFGSHLQVTALDGNNSLETTPIIYDEELYRKLYGMNGVMNVNTYAVKGGIIKTDDAFQGVLIKGLDEDYDWSFFSDLITEGSLPVSEDEGRQRELLISENLANRLQTHTGDRIEVLFHTENMRPRREQYRISGLYSTGFEEMDLVTVLTRIGNIRRAGSWSDKYITGYEITVRDFSHIPEIRTEVYSALLEQPAPDGQYLMVTDITQQFANLFDWLKAHNVNAAVIITIMLVVSLLNMISALLIILLERTKMIGILKALGMNNGSLQRLFLIRSASIITKGLLWGTVAGITICLVQKYTHLIKLDQTGYFLSEVPIALGWQWILALNAGTLLFLVLILFIPTFVVSSIKPEKTIRYQ